MQRPSPCRASVSGRATACAPCASTSPAGRSRRPANSSPRPDAVTYRRFEPVGPPAALALRPFWPGESLERIVPAATGTATARPSTSRRWARGAGRVAHRGVTCSPQGQQMAELHGKLDAPSGRRGDPDAGYRIALRESGNLPRRGDLRRQHRRCRQATAHDSVRAPRADGAARPGDAAPPA